MGLALLLIFGLLGLLHWVVLPARIDDVRRIGAKMPTLQVTTLERVDYLERCRYLCRVGMVLEVVLVLVWLGNT